MGIEGTTGNGATAVFTAGTFLLNIDSIALGDSAGGFIDVSHLGSAIDMESIPFDLATTPESVIEGFFNDEDDLPVANDVDTLTITFEQQADQSSAATFVGTVIITNVGLPTLVNNDVSKITISSKFDGITGPTFTKAVSP